MMKDNMKKMESFQKLNYRPKILSNLFKNKKWNRLNLKKKVPNKDILDHLNQKKGMKQIIRKVPSLLVQKLISILIQRPSTRWL